MSYAGYVPDALSSSVIVPVPKVDGSKDDVLKGYRPVALSSVMVKVSETCLMLCLQHYYIIADSLQFGFVLSKGYQKALPMLKSFFDYFIQVDRDTFCIHTCFLRVK